MGKRTRAGAGARDRLWTPLFALLVVMSFFIFVVAQGFNAGTSVYLDASGMGAQYAGVAAMVFSFAAGVMRLFCGPLIDTRGRFRMIVAGYIVLLIATFAPTLKLGLGVLIACRALQGVGFAIVTTAAATMASDALPVSRLGEGIGYFGLGQAIAMSVGPAFAIFLVSTDPPENLYAALTLLTATAFALSFFCRYENDVERLPATSAYRTRIERLGERAGADGAKPDAPSDEGATPSAAPSFASRIFEKSALAGAVPAVLMAPFLGFSLYFGGLLGTDLGIPNPGLYYTLSAVSIIGVRLASRRFMDALPPVVTMGVGTGAGAVCAVLYFLAYLSAGNGAHGAAQALFYAAGLAFGMYNGLLLPLTQSVAVKCTPPERWGAANALSQLAVDVGIGAGAVLWGFTNEAFGYPVTFALCLAFAAAAFAAAAVMFPKKGAEDTQTDA